MIGHLPTLAVLLTSGSFSAMQLAQAARGRARLLFVVDPDDTSSDEHRLLQRLGTVVEATSTEAVAQQLREHEASGVVTYTDGSLDEAAQLAEELRLPFHTAEVAEGLTDKFLQRRLLREAGLRVPSCLVVESGQHLDLDLGAVALPAVVKPRRGSGSREARRVGTVEELRAALEAESAEDVVVEGYLGDRTPRGQQRAADIVSVESVVERGHHRVLAVTGRFPLAEPFRETGSFMPAVIASPDREAVVDLARAAAAALGVHHGFLHTEVKLTPEGPSVVEVNGRIGGGVPQMLESIGGPSLLDWSMRMALGQPLPEDTSQRRGVGYFLWVQPPVEAREVVGVEGVDRLQRVDGVSQVRLNRAPGEPVDWRLGGLEHVVGVEGLVEDHEALWSVREHVLDTVDVAYA